MHYTLHRKARAAQWPLCAPAPKVQHPVSASSLSIIPRMQRSSSSSSLCIDYKPVTQMMRVAPGLVNYTLPCAIALAYLHTHTQAENLMRGRNKGAQRAYTVHRKKRERSLERERYIKRGEDWEEEEGVIKQREELSSQSIYIRKAAYVYSRNRRPLRHFRRPFLPPPYTLSVHTGIYIYTYI